MEISVETSEEKFEHFRLCIFELVLLLFRTIFRQWKFRSKITEMFDPKKKTIFFAFGSLNWFYYYLDIWANENFGRKNPKKKSGNFRLCIFELVLLLFRTIFGQWKFRSKKIARKKTRKCSPLYF